jgi:hypothetical protein
MKVSPKYMMLLVSKIDRAIWEHFLSSEEVVRYIDRWHEHEGNGYNNYWENFTIARYQTGDIDLLTTLHNIKDDELLLKIAVDVEIEIPELVYSIPEIKGILSSGYESASKTFENALKKVSTEPATAICCANSALESIIKHICENESIASCNPKDTLYDLTQHILKEFKYYPTRELEVEIKCIGSGLLTVAQNIEAIRSKYIDTSHGKASEDYIIDDELYAKFIVNSVTTVGLFLLNFYEKKYLPQQNSQLLSDDIPF